MSSLGWHCITKVDAHTVMSFGRLAKIKVLITFWYVHASNFKTFQWDADGQY
jgi:hypothetical protein